jgi:predicted DNA-binding transcriptional regulator AlpA
MQLAEKQSGRGSPGRSPEIARPKGQGGDVSVTANSAAIQSDSRDAYSIPEFAARHGLSRSHLYEVIKAGDGPSIMKVGRRSLISREAAAAWRKHMEAAR